MISGEQFQQLAEVSFYSSMTDIISNQQNHLYQNLKSIHDTPAEEISNYKTVFIYAHFLDDFFAKFYNHITPNTVLISHNSDEGIHDRFLKYLESDKILKWYCQNRETQHNKLFSIPIGLANSQWEHGNQQLITSVRDKNNIKDILVLKNYDINTNFSERESCNRITSLNGIHMSPKTTTEEYWNLLSRSTFVISPPGNGIDCHRIWESLYLKTIPVVKYNKAFSQFTHLPILFIDDWNTVNIDFLTEMNKLYQSINFDIPDMYIDYWRERILL